MGLLYMEFCDGIREGDGARIIRCWRYFLPMFKASGRTNYVVEAFNLLFQLHWTKSKISCTSLTEGYISYTPHSISCTFSVPETWCVGNNFLYCMGSPCILHCFWYLSARLSCAEWVDHVSCTVSGTYRLVCPVLNGFTMYPALFLVHAGEIAAERSSLAEHSKVSSSMSCSQTEGFSDSG